MKLAPIAEMSIAEREACIQAFLRDDADVAKRVDAAELLECVADAWSDKADMHNKAVAVKPGREQAVLDCIMECAYPGESLPLSYARLLRAVGCMGFPYVTAFTARAAYLIYPQLTEKPYGGRKNKPSCADRG